MMRGPAATTISIITPSGYDYDFRPPTLYTHTAPKIKIIPFFPSTWFSGEKK